MSRNTYRRFWLALFASCLIPSSLAQSQPPPPANATMAVEELAAALVAAKTEEERAALLSTKKELQTPALVRAMLIRGGPLRTQKFASPASLQQALATFQLAQRLAERMGDKGNTAWALFSLGDVYRNQGDQSFALEHYQQSLALYEAIGAQPGMAYVMLNIGHFYSSQRDFGSALKYYKKSAAFHESFSDWTAIAVAHIHVGEAYRALKNPDSALVAYQKALKIFEASGDKSGTARVLNNIGVVYAEQGKEGLAREAQQKSLALSEELKRAGRNPATDAGALQKLTDRLMALETDEKRKAWLDAEQAMATRELMRVLVARGGQLAGQRNYSKAISSYLLAVQIGERVGDRIAAAMALDSIALVYGNQRNYRMAQEYNEKSLEIWERTGVQAGIVQSLHRLGTNSRSRQNYGLALWYYRKARSIAEAAESTEMANMALQSMGNTYTRIGQYDRAEECLKQAVAHAAAVGSKLGVAHGHHFFFILYAQQG